MIIVDVEVHLEEGESIDGVREAFKAIDEASQQETGCLKYVSSVDVNDPTIIRIYEQWESMEVLKPHFQTAHMRAFQEALGGLKVKCMDAKVYEVAGELPFPNA